MGRVCLRGCNDWCHSWMVTFFSSGFSFFAFSCLLLSGLGSYQDRDTAFRTLCYLHIFFRRILTFANTYSGLSSTPRVIVRYLRLFFFSLCIANSTIGIGFTKYFGWASFLPYQVSSFSALLSLPDRNSLFFYTLRCACYVLRYCT